MRYEYYAWVTNVVDGDTIDVTIDLGLRLKADVRIRIYGIDAPERYTPEGRLARTWLQNEILASQVLLKTHKDATEKYGRWLAEIYKGDTDIAKAMVAAGKAKFREY